ncbi:hypothetical protein L1077_04270 [Pseudoalteromonas luteoviolacea]|uniref:hypothetical protein n=1 Tax=Pseudoalteromonas luteoviolacea TaxID=43657 RepID=UPI001F3FEA20|nr:hypothetical protein [Pseudoalteromonas luteoviolacea]MCF6438643.1 hypothetical protein [Pseudoalteromonas luteoviolacea]
MQRSSIRLLNAKRAFTFYSNTLQQNLDVRIINETVMTKRFVLFKLTHSKDRQMAIIAEAEYKNNHLVLSLVGDVDKGSRKLFRTEAKRAFNNFINDNSISYSGEIYNSCFV